MLRESWSKYILNGNALSRILAINIAVFILLNVVHVFIFLFNENEFLSAAAYYLGLKSDIKLLLYHPWSIITHFWVHINLFHLIWNMLMLYMAGRIFMEYLGNKKLLSVFILGALSGALLYITAYNIFPRFQDSIHSSYAIGASAGVLAVLTAIAFYVPNYIVRLMFLGNVKLVYIAAVFILLDIINFEKGNFGGHLAHIGGALFGIIFTHFHKKGKDITGNFNKVADSLSSTFKPSGRGNLKVAYKRKVSDEEYNLNKIKEQQKIDMILDKISKSGYESLTKAEKEILFKMSNKK